MGTSNRPEGREAALARADTLMPSSTGDGGNATISESPHAKASAPVRTKARATALARGTTVSRYVVIDLIGAGGMGRVYAAFDPELGRQVALKVVSPGEHDDAPASSRSRLLREAQAMARVSHPNVIPVFDVGTFDDDVFVAMELRHGSNLSTWLLTPRTVKDILAVFVQAGRGLAAAHAVGLVHRDFKPDNVHVGDDRRVCVLDFGLARPAADLATPPPELSSSSSGPALAASDRHTPLPSAPLTVEGALIGTPQYMAPEQHRREVADALTDQFSFCVALYEALCGQRPFAGKTLAELARNVNGGRITHAARERELPAWLRALLARGLKVRPDERYPSMDALLRDLDRQSARTRGAVLVAGSVLVAGAAVAFAAMPRDRAAAAPPSVCTGAPAQMAEVWSPARAQAIRASFTATGVPYGADSAQRVIDALDRYAQQWASVHTGACEATRVRGERSEALLDRAALCLERRRIEVDALAGVLAKATPPVVEQAVGAVATLRAPDTCLREGDERPALPAGSEARAAAIEHKLAEATALRGAGRYPDGLAIARAATTDAVALAYPPLVAETAYLEGTLASDSGDAATSLPRLEDAWLAATSVRLDELAARIAIDRIQAAFAAGKLDEAQALARAAEAAVARLDRDERLSADLDIAVGALLGKQARFDAAGPRLERAIAALEHIPGSEARLATAVHRLAGMNHTRGRHAEALAGFERVVAVREALFGADHPMVASSRINVAAVAIYLGRNEEAIATLDRAWPVLLAKLGPAHMNLAKLRNNRGLALAHLGRFQEAYEEHQRSLAMLGSLVAADSIELTSTLLNLAWAAKSLGKFDEALAVEERCLAIYETTYGPKHVDVAYPLTGIGRTWLLRGEPARALAPLERAYKLREANEVDRADRAETRFLLARARWDTNRDRAAARALAASAREDYAAAVADNPTLAKERNEIDSWLASHPVP